VVWLAPKRAAAAAAARMAVRSLVQADPGATGVGRAAPPTSVLSLGDAICSNPEVGGYIAASCDDPIEFIFNDTARCCCAD
jgi:hypothetical protein